MNISRNRLLPAVFCASIASLLALGTASAAHAGAGTPYATIQIQNNFASSLADAPQYFGQSIADDQVWLYLLADPGNLTYKNSPTSGSTPFTHNQWVQLSQIDSGIIYAAVGSTKAVMYAVISKNQPLNPPNPAPPPCASSPCTDLAYAAMEWNFSVPSQENVDIQNIDQFSFTSRMTVTKPSGTPVARTGFSGSTSSQAILEQIQTNCGGESCNYPGANFPANYPLTPTNCPMPTGNQQGPYGCIGLPADYLTQSQSNMGRYNQKISVTTGIDAVDSAAYRWVGPSKSQDSEIPGYYVNVWQGFGNSFEPYLTALFNSPQNTSGYYVDFNGNGGYSFIFKVTQGANSNRHGIEITTIRVGTNQSDNVNGVVSRQAGTLLTGTIAILANGEPILDWAADGCPASNSNKVVNHYGLWTDAVLQTGAAVLGCYGEFGSGPVIMPTDNTITQELFPAIVGTMSAVLTYGIITPEWNPADAGPGTNYVFATAQKQNQDSLFQAGDGNADVWTRTLWQYQDLSTVPNSDPSVDGTPLYVFPYSDRFKVLNPHMTVQRDDKILWELGVPMSISSTACPADFQHSGFVDGADLGTLLNAWGQCSGTCVADLNHDSAVTGADIGILLNAWGPCAH